MWINIKVGDAKRGRMQDSHKLTALIAGAAAVVVVAFKTVIDVAVAVVALRA